MDAQWSDACAGPVTIDDGMLSPHSAGYAERMIDAFLNKDQAGSVLDRGPALESVVIVWREPQGDLPDLTRWLYRISGMGAWNHLDLPMSGILADQLAGYAQANPNIIHSICRREPSTVSADGRCRFPEGHPAYGRTRRLPGRPLWQALQDPLRIQACVAQWGAARLMRTHVLEDPQRLYQIGSGLEYHYKPPSQLPAGYLDEICAMVEAGGSVGTQFLRFNLERAFLIAYVEENRILVGNSSLKQPRPEYIEAVSRQSGIDLTHFLERGYTSVRPEYRGLGIGAQLLEGLTRRAAGHSIFSVIAESNIATQKMAIRNRTRKVAAFYSHRAEKQVGIWIPEWMVPAGLKLPPQPDVT